MIVYYDYETFWIIMQQIIKIDKNEFYSHLIYLFNDYILYCIFRSTRNMLLLIFRN